MPIVRATGGLDDTVESFDEATGEGSGFKLQDLYVESLVATVKWAVDTYREKPAAFRAMQRRAMKKSFGWGVAASHYAEVYEWAIGARRA